MSYHNSYRGYGSQYGYDQSPRGYNDHNSGYGHNPYGSDWGGYDERKDYRARDRYQEAPPRREPMPLSGKGLPDSVDDATIYDIFRPLSKITEIRWLYNSDGTSKGIGFVEFEDNVAEKATKHNGMFVHGAKMYVKRTTPKIG